jgi:hypothetical protein
MNSQFKNSKIGTILYIFIIAVVVLVTILIFWFMLFGYKVGTYSEDTVLGSVYLGGLHNNEVNSKVEDKYVDWLNDETIVYELTYQGYSYEFDRDLFSFDIDLSMSQLVDGETNELIVQYQDGGTDRIDTINEIEELVFLQGIIDNVDVEALIRDILVDAGMMKTYSAKKVENYLKIPEDSYVTRPYSAIPLPLGIEGDDIIDGITAVYGSNVIIVNSKQLFDVTEQLGLELDDNELTILSRGIVKQLLETNFTLHEMHYDANIDFGSYNLSNFPNKGTNVVVDRDTFESFSFYNPNDSNYMLEVVYDSGTDSIQVSLVGLEFVDTIVVTGDDAGIEIPYVTKIDPFSNPAPGYPGMVVVITRTITDIYGVSIESDIAFEFYPPIVEIVNE